MRTKLGKTNTSLLAVIFLFVTGVRGIDAGQHNSTQSGTDPGVRLVIQTSRREYRAGTSIDIVAYLRNNADSPYYVGNYLGHLLSILPYHYLELSIYDRKGHDVWVGRGGGSAVEIRGQTPVQKIAEHYTLLWPDGIYGLREMLKLKLHPGRYQLKATYHETEAPRWTEEERASLRFPVWTRMIVSDTINIAITR
jgi:hypothetical protein